MSGKVTSVYLRPRDDFYCEVSFEGINWYVFHRVNIHPKKWLEELLYIIEHTENEMVLVDGIYDKENKLLHLRYDKIIHRLYARIIKLLSLTESGQTFLVDEEAQRRGHIIPIDVKLVAYKEPLVGFNYIVETATEDSRVFANPSGGSRRVGCIIVDYEPVERVDGDTNRYRATLWIPDNKEVAPTGKLGSHLAAFADYFGEESDALVKTLEPTEWLGKTVTIIQWSEKARKIIVLKN